MDYVQPVLDQVPFLVLLSLAKRKGSHNVNLAISKMLRERKIMSRSKYKKKKKKGIFKAVEILQLFYQFISAIHIYMVYRSSSMVSFWLNKIIHNWIACLNVSFLVIPEHLGILYFLIHHVKLEKCHILFPSFSCWRVFPSWKPF